MRAPGRIVPAPVVPAPLVPAIVVLAACLVVPALLAGCGGPGAIPDVDLLVRVRPGQTTVRTGQGFPLTVTRVWRKDIEPSPFDDGMLAPLVVRAQSTERREDRLRIEETRTFRAYAFSLQDLTIPPVLLVGRSIGGSGKVLTRSEAVPLQVLPALDPKDPGPPELPDVPQPLRSTGPLILLGLLLAVLSGAYLVRRQARRGRSPAPGPVGADEACLTAEARLARLAAEGAGGVAIATGVADIVRAFVGAQHGLPVAERTSEEIVAALPDAQRPSLRAIFSPCDRVKFAAHVPSNHAGEQLLEAARRYVRAGGTVRA